MTVLNRYFWEPVNALTHLIGAVASFVSLIFLLILTRDDPPKMISMLIYGISMVALYSASTLFHGMKADASRRMWLNRLDHMAIFLVMAGTYTPIVYNLFTDWWRWGVLAVVWTAAIGGMIYKLLSAKIHGFFNATIYLILGWGVALPLIFASNPFSLVSLWGMFLIALGGLFYMVGFVIYYLKRPNPWPHVLGHHEIWHLLVMAATGCHFLFIWWYVVPFERIA